MNPTPISNVPQPAQVAAIPTDTRSIDERLLPSPQQVDRSLGRKDPYSPEQLEAPTAKRTMAAKKLACLSLNLGTLAGVGLGVLTALAIAGTMVTPVGWAILGGAAALALILSAVDQPYNIGNTFLGIVGGFVFGLAAGALASPMEQGLFMADIVFGLGGGGGLNLLAQSNYMFADSFHEKPETKWLNLASPEYGVPEQEKQYQTFLNACLNDKEVRHIKVDDQGQLEFISPHRYDKERFKSNFRTFSAINQKVVELQFLKFLAQGVKKGWINKEFTAEQQERLLKRIGLSQPDMEFTQCMDSIRQSVVKPSEIGGMMVELDMISRVFFDKYVKKIAQKQGTEETVTAFYLEKGNELMKKGDPLSAIFYFGLGVQIDSPRRFAFIQKISECYAKGIGIKQDFGKAWKWANELRGYLRRVESAKILHAELQKEKAEKGKNSFKLLSEAASYFEDIRDIENLKTMAQELFKEGYLELAEKGFVICRDEKGMHQVAQAYLKKNEYEHAVQCYADICLVRYPNLNPSKYSYDLPQYHVSHATGAALQLLDKAYAINKRDPSVNMALGLTYQYGIQTPKDLEKAVAHYKMAVAVEKDKNGPAHDALRKLGIENV